MGNMNETASRGETPLSPSSIVFLDVMVNNTTEEQCFSSNSHSSVLQGLPFGGIPTVLVLNFIIWLLLLLVFSCIRKAAWDYGRLALLMDNDSLTSLFYGEQSEKEKSPSETSPLDADNKDVGFCSWLHSIYQMNDHLLWLHSIFALLYFILTVLCMAHHSIRLDYKESEKVDAEQYYGELEEKLTDEFNAERSRIMLKRLDIAFVTFQDERMTATILKDFSHIRCRKHPQQSSVTTVVKSHCWNVRYAPAPCDLKWENLSVHGVSWWMRFVLLNTCLFILLFFLTTPTIIVSTIDRFNVTRPAESLQSPIVTQFLPTLLLWAFSVFLPFIVYYSAYFESHWTRTTENQLTMHKCYFFLVFMVLILPSLGLTRCVFLPDHGAFFVNYIITASLIGTAMDLLRIPGLIVYATRLCFAKSEPERLHVKRVGGSSAPTHTVSHA
ncbi:hypothetical protein lerEdw1_015394 [Lerista edwardsae]|nr:hypothetical protein lerEdw1_015394 [Lerista edwardsae]